MTISITLTLTHTLAVSHDPYPYTLRETVRTERYPYPHTLQPMDHRYHTPLPNATLASSRVTLNTGTQLTTQKRGRFVY